MINISLSDGGVFRTLFRSHSQDGKNQDNIKCPGQDK